MFWCRQEDGVSLLTTRFIAIAERRHDNAKLSKRVISVFFFTPAAIRSNNFFKFLPAVGLNHVSGCGKGHGYGCKACFDRQSNDAGHRCDERASIPQKVFFIFFSNFSAKRTSSFTLRGVSKLAKLAKLATIVGL